MTTIKASGRDLELKGDQDIVFYPTDNIWISQGTKLIFEGTVPDNFEAKLQATSVTADRDIILPDSDGTLATQEWVNLQGFGSGGGGATALSALTDVDVTGAINGSVLKYNTTSSAWEIGTDNSGSGSSFDQSLNTTDNVTFNDVTVNGDLTVTGAATTSIQAGANIELDAANRVLVTDTPFRLASLTTTERNAIAAPDNGDLIYNSTTKAVESYVNGSWESASSTTFTKFVFTNSQPASSTANSAYIGETLGTWYECTFANAASTFGLSPDSADRDPTLQGITFSGNQFSGFEQGGTYEFHISPELYERTTTEGIRVHSWEVSTGAFSNMSVYSPGTASFNINGLSCNDHIIVTFEDATPANNWIRYSLDSDQSNIYWIGQAILHIKKIG